MNFNQKNSYDYGICAESLLGFTLFEHLDNIAAQNPQIEAVVSPLEEARFTYGEFAAVTESVARALLARGVERGDRVGIWSTNNWRWLAVLFAVSRVGAILVNINPSYRTHELEYVLKQSGTKVLFTIARNRASNYLQMLEELAPRLFGRGREAHASTVPDLQDIILMPSVDYSGAVPADAVGEVFDWTTFMAQAAVPREITLDELKSRQATVQFDDAVNIQYTSGTTGFPKGVTLSHHNLLNNGLFAARAMALDSTSRFCVPMPFYHCGGMVSSALSTFSVGGTLVLPGPYFEELSTLKTLQSERCSHVSGVPTMFIGQLEHEKFKDFDLSSLRGGFMAGAPCPVQLMRRVASEMHVPEVVILYGLTEVSPLMTATTIHDSMETRATTVGRAISGVEVKIIDTDGAVVPRGSQGEICCRGHGIMLGYWLNDEATSECIDAAGWLHSGDLGVMNAEGYLHITGRKKDMIIRGGENIYPRELEEIFHQHEAIAQAQVFGVPDERLGEEVAVWVMLKAGATLSEGDLKAWLAQRVAHFKVPRYFKFVAEFPMTVTGKIQKFVMRQRMVEELNLQAAASIETA